MKVHDLGAPFAGEISREYTQECQILARILVHYVPEGSEFAVSQKLLEAYGSLPQLMLSDRPGLIRRNTSNPDIAEFIAGISAAMRICMEKRIAERVAWDNWQSLIAFVRSQIAYRSKQCLLAIFSNDDREILTQEVLQEGSIHSVMVYPRQIAVTAFEYGASSLILAKNVPTGSLVATPEDIQKVVELRGILAKLDISLLDFLNIGPTGEWSFRIEGI